MQISDPLDKFFHRASVAIDNGLTIPKIQSYLNQYGYNISKIEQGKTLYDKALQATQEQHKQYGQQISATEAFNQSWKTAQESYIRYLKIARIAFLKDTGITTELGLTGKRKRNFSGWLAQANQFYSNALNNPQILAGLNEYNITKAKLEAGQADIKAVEAASLRQEKAKGEAQNSTKKRNEAVNELHHWLRDFIAIARIALEPEPQLLESLGIIVKS